MASPSIAKKGSTGFARQALFWIEGIEEQLGDIPANADGALSHLESQDDEDRDGVAYGILRVIKEQAEGAASLQHLRALTAGADNA